MLRLTVVGVLLAVVTISLVTRSAAAYYVGSCLFIASLFIRPRYRRRR